MAGTDEKISECIEKSLNYLSAIDRPIVLKCEQRISIQHLLLGKDVIAILPTGFGKSMIFTVYALAKSEMVKMSGNSNNDGCSVLVVSPLRSIINDQIAYLQSINFSAVELSDKTFADVVGSPPQGKQGKCKKPYIPITLANKGVNLMINCLISYHCT